MHTELVYRTFSELMDAVRTDFKTLSLEGMIDEGDLVKVAQKVNYELGLKLNPCRQVILDVEQFKTRLPSDFKILNFVAELGQRKPLPHQDHPKAYHLIQLAEALKNLPFTHPEPDVKSYTLTLDIPAGTTDIRHNLNSEAVILQIKSDEGNVVITDFEELCSNEIRIKAYVPYPRAKVVVLGKGEPSPLDNPRISREPEQHLIPIPNPVKPKQWSIDDFESYRLLTIRPDRSVLQNDECIRYSSLSDCEAYLKNGFLVTRFQTGKVLVNYQGDMEDEEGNLLVLDHPQCNDYYEYALKQRILENLTMNGEPQHNNLQLIDARLRPARNNAVSFTRMPDFRQMKDLWERNRRVQYRKYYSIIAS